MKKLLIIIALLPLLVGCSFRVTKLEDGVKARGKGIYKETVAPDGETILIEVDTKGEPIISLQKIEVDN